MILLKKSLKVILKTSNYSDIVENVISEETKCFQAIFKNATTTDVLRRIRTKKRQAKYFRKQTGDLRETYFEKDWSEGFNDFIVDKRKELWKFHKILLTK